MCLALEYTYDKEWKCAYFLTKWYLLISWDTVWKVIWNRKKNEEKIEEDISGKLTSIWFRYRKLSNSCKIHVDDYWNWSDLHWQEKVIYDPNWNWPYIVWSYLWITNPNLHRLAKIYTKTGDYYIQPRDDTTTWLVSWW